MLLRSSEIKPLFIDLSPTQQCLKHSLPALFVPPSPLHINPPIANRVRPAMATFPLPWLHHRCRSSLRRALAASRHLSISSLSSLPPPSFRITEQHREFRQLALPFQPFASSLFSFALLGGFGRRLTNTHDQPSTLSALSLSIYPLCT